MEVQLLNAGMIFGSPMPEHGYDIIGDIHGFAGELEALLARMGYTHTTGTWRHPNRQAIFLGDFIDRGPRQLDTLRLVRAMVEGGSALAVMGNHEYNAILWHTPDPHHPGEYLRRRSGRLEEKNRHQHAAFLREVGEDGPDHSEWVTWFKSLPLWLDLPGFRVIHACWHPRHLQHLALKVTADGRLTDDLLLAGSRKGSPEYEALECLLKGLEIDLPDGVTFQDKDGHTRNTTRLKWWDPTAETYRDAAHLPANACLALPDDPLPEEARVEVDVTKPLFVGHYWLHGARVPLGPTVACVDYSAGKGDPLVAYRWSGEKILLAEHYVSSRPQEAFQEPMKELDSLD